MGLTSEETAVLSEISRQSVAAFLKDPRVSTLHAIANLAITAETLDQEAKREKADLHAAYFGFKKRRGIDHIEANTPEWDQMMEETRGEYASVQAAKRKACTAPGPLDSRLHYAAHGRFWSSHL